MRTPWKILEEVYDKAGLPLTPQTRARLQEYLGAHPRGKAGQVLYDLQGDFGVDPAEVRERFRFYFDRFAVQQETH